MTLAEALDLKTDLVDDEHETLEKPLKYHSRTNQILPDETSQVQKQLIELEEYAHANEIKINKDKTKVMLFNTAKTRDFPPNMKID